MSASSEVRLQRLQAFRAKPKYVADALYTGVHDPVVRLRFTARLDALASELEPLTQAPDPKPALLRAFERAWPTFEMADTEDRERTLGYFEELMAVFGVESSDGLLNRLMYGFDPKQPADTRNQQAWAAMTESERTMATKLMTLTASAAEAELRRRLGPPAVTLPDTMGWALDDRLQSIIQISRVGRKARLVWVFRGQLWATELREP